MALPPPSSPTRSVHQSAQPPSSPPSENQGILRSPSESDPIVVTTIPWLDVPPGAHQTRSNWSWLVAAALFGVIGVAATLAIVNKGFKSTDAIPKADWWNWAVGAVGGATMGVIVLAIWRCCHPQPSLILEESSEPSSTASSPRAAPAEDTHAVAYPLILMNEAELSAPGGQLRPHCDQRTTLSNEKGISLESFSQWQAMKGRVATPSDLGKMRHLWKSPTERNATEWILPLVLDNQGTLGLLWISHSLVDSQSEKGLIYIIKSPNVPTPPILYPKDKFTLIEVARKSS